MEKIKDFIVSSEILIEILVSVSIVFLIFLVNEHLRRYKENKRNLGILERRVRENHKKLVGNTGLLHQWLESLDSKKPYSCVFARFQEFTAEDTMLSSNLLLVNSLVKQNDFFMGFNEEIIDNFYSSYSETRNRATSGQLDLAVWNKYQDNLIKQMSGFFDKAEKQKEEVLDLLALIRALYMISRYSLVGFLYEVATYNFFPRLTEDRISKSKKALKEKIRHNFWQGEIVSFVESNLVTKGVICNVYSYDKDGTKDLGIISVKAGEKTPLQKVLRGDKTIEGYIEGKGKLVVDDKEYLFPNDENKEVEVKVGQTMQWHAETDLKFYEICFPPYKDGRYEDLDETN